MKKIILWSVVAVLVIGTAGAGLWWLSRPQTVLLKDGTKLTLLGVTSGRHHVPPKINGARNRSGGAFDTESNSVVVWIESESKKKAPDQNLNYQLFVCDSAQTACVSTWSRGGNQIKNGVKVLGFPLDAYPRRDRSIILRVGAWNNRGGEMQVAKGQFVISNPDHGKSFPQWAADPMPDTQSDGDLKVTLAKLVYGVPGFGSRSSSSKDPMNKAVRAVFHCEQKGVVATNWQVERIETSDATGNHVENNSWSTSRDANGDATMTYQWGLWPADSPWKIRAEMSRTSGFNDSESWSVTNVPVQPGKWNDMWNSNPQNGPTKAAFAETTLNGIHLKLFPAIQVTDQNFGGGRQGGIHINIKPNLPEGYRLSIIATDEQGRALQGWGPNGGGGSYTSQIQNLRGKTVNVTVAVHKSRFVEFTVNPQKP